jgi:hypothetical protein
VNYHDIRRTADRVRDIPLEDVLQVAGARRDPCDREKWHTDRGNISVTGAKFFNWNLGIGGGGAIDLVIHLEALDFKATVEWLVDHFPQWAPSGGARPRDRRCARTLTLPSPDPSGLPAVLRYLVYERFIDLAALLPLIEAGDIYADSRSNAVFLMRGDQQRPVGAEIRGITARIWRSLAPGSRRDPISCSIVRPQSRCVSTAGARPNPRWLTKLLANPKPIYCAFDADPAGDRAANAMIELHPRARRLRPACHDWNDVLRAGR